MQPRDRHCFKIIKVSDRKNYSQLVSIKIFLTSTDQAASNGVKLEPMSPQQVQQIEPEAGDDSDLSDSQNDIELMDVTGCYWMLLDVSGC